MQYVELSIVRYAAKILAVADEAGLPIGCEVETADGMCGRPVHYLVPDATRPGGGGADIEQRPAMVCLEHLEEMLGHTPERQPLFRRLQGPDPDPGA